MNVGNTIRKLRLEKDLTQIEFSGLIGISQTSLCQIERNQSRPYTKTLQNICKALDTNEMYIYYLSMEDSDIPENKKVLYKEIKPVFDKLVKSLFE